MFEIVTKEQFAVVDGNDWLLDGQAPVFDTKAEALAFAQAKFSPYSHHRPLLVVPVTRIEALPVKRN